MEGGSEGALLGENFGRILATCLYVEGLVVGETETRWVDKAEGTEVNGSAINIASLLLDDGLINNEGSKPKSEGSAVVETIAFESCSGRFEAELYEQFITMTANKRLNSIRKVRERIETPPQNSVNYRRLNDCDF